MRWPSDGDGERDLYSQAYQRGEQHRDCSNSNCVLSTNPSFISIKWPGQVQGLRCHIFTGSLRKVLHADFELQCERPYENECYHWLSKQNIILPCSHCLFHCCCEILEVQIWNQRNFIAIGCTAGLVQRVCWCRTWVRVGSCFLVCFLFHLQVNSGEIIASDKRLVMGQNPVPHGVPSLTLVFPIIVGCKPSLLMVKCWPRATCVKFHHLIAGQISPIPLPLTATLHRSVHCY